jgi:Protein kinase domain
MSLAAGTRVGAYEILAPLGAGGMGEVYRARDTRLGREVAIKFLGPRFATQPGASQRLLEEARAASALNHANIVALHDICSENGNEFLVMELVRGKTLDHLIGNRGLLPVTTALKFAIPIADALAPAHLRFTLPHLSMCLITRERPDFQSVLRGYLPGDGAALLAGWPIWLVERSDLQSTVRWQTGARHRSHRAQKLCGV